MIFLLHLIATSALFGAIWYIQLVHYPLYRFVGEKEFSAYHLRNICMTASVVIPLMVLELFTGFWLWWNAVDAQKTEFFVGLLLLGVCWGSTLFFQIPYHWNLIRMKDERILKRLIQTNWIRTIVWSLRVCLLLKIMGV